MPLLTDTVTHLERDARAKLRTPWPYVESLADPLVMLLLFAPLAAAVGAAPSTASGSTMQWFAPGILVIMAFGTCAFIGAGLQEERASGSLERIAATPTSRSAILAGRALRAALTVVVQALVIVAVTTPLGLTFSVVGVLGAAVVLAALAVGISFLSLALGVALDSSYAFWGVLTLAYTPLIVTSGALLPMQVAPDWLYTLSRFNPMAHAVDGLRSLFAGDLTDPSIAVALGAAAAMVIAGAALGNRALRHLRA
jgi:ABC-2 type transport system permease protein